MCVFFLSVNNHIPSIIRVTCGLIQTNKQKRVRLRLMLLLVGFLSTLSAHLVQNPRRRRRRRRRRVVSLPPPPSPPTRVRVWRRTILPNPPPVDSHIVGMIQPWVVVDDGEWLFFLSYTMSSLPSSAVLL